MDEQPTADAATVDESVPPVATDVQVDPQVEATVPAEPTDGEEKPVEKAEPTEPNAEDMKKKLDALAELNARNQTNYQNLVATTKKYDPSIYEEHREAVSTPEVEPPTEVDDFEEQEPMTKGDLQGMEDRLFNRMTGADKKTKMAKAAVDAKTEYGESNTLLDQYLVDNNVPDEVFDWAMKMVAPIGIDIGTKENPVLGGSSRYVYALTLQMQPWVDAQLKAAQETVRLGNIEVDAADRGRNSAAGMQPAAGHTGIVGSDAGQKMADKISPKTPYVYRPD